MPNLVKASKIPLSSWIRRRDEEFKEYIPRVPKPFRLIDPLHKRAIVIPWLSTGAKWKELCYALRAIDKFWLDKECPIYIIGDAPPTFLKEGGRVSFIRIKEYAISNQAGLWEAWQIGMQIADEVGWWNDDIYLLRETDWNDLRVALEEGDLTNEDQTLRKSTNLWQQALGESVTEMKRQGKEKVLRFATHTPYLFEREKSLEIFRTYYLHHKGSWVNLYYNHHETPHTSCAPHKAIKLPANQGERFYNHKHIGPDKKSQCQLESMFPDKASWEI